MYLFKKNAITHKKYCWTMSFLQRMKGSNVVMVDFIYNYELLVLIFLIRTNKNYYIIRKVFLLDKNACIRLKNSQEVTSILSTSKILYLNIKSTRTFWKNNKKISFNMLLSFTLFKQPIFQKHFKTTSSIKN